jgi:hypothetical protein
VRTIGKGKDVVEPRLTAAAINRPLALLRHLLRLAHEEWVNWTSSLRSAPRKSLTDGSGG